MKLIKLPFSIAFALTFLAVIGCANPSGSGGSEDPNSPSNPSGPGESSEIVFADGTEVTRRILDGSYTNRVSGSGAGTLSYSSGSTAVATVDPETGEVHPLAEGSTLITATKAATDTHNAVTRSYTLNIISGDYVSDLVGTLKYVPAGRFQYDGTPGNDRTVGAFRIGQHEITRTQYLQIMGVDRTYEAFSTGQNDPVSNVNWYQALAFCNKLSIAEGLTPVYSVAGVDDWANLVFYDIPYYMIDPPVGHDALKSVWDAATVDEEADGYRLPSEAEWMWAAMGAPAAGRNGGVDTVSYLKPFAGSDGANSIDDFAWYSGIAANKTHPVGSKSPNELALYDLSGNVWERCFEWHPKYPGVFRLTCGGGFQNSTSKCEISINGRNGLMPDGASEDCGFRVLRR